MPPNLKPIAAAMSILILFLYFTCFCLVAYKALLGAHLPIFDGIDENQPLAYIWTTMSTLVGGIVAVAFGQPKPQRSWTDPAQILTWYCWVYIVVGAVALLIFCFAVVAGGWAKAGEYPLLIKNAAITFLGLIGPIVSDFLRPQGGNVGI